MSESFAPTRRSVLVGAGGAAIAAASGLALPESAYAAGPVLFSNTGTWPGASPNAFNKIHRALDSDLGKGNIATYAVQQKPGHLKFEARYGDREDNGRYHREVGLVANGGSVPWDTIGREGLTRLYKFSVYVPDEGDDASNWIINKYDVMIAQIHCMQGASPVMFFQMRNDRLELHFRVPQRLGLDPLEGVFLCSVNYMKGKWTEIAIRVAWGRERGGYRVWIDGQEKSRQDGRTLFAGTKPEPGLPQGTNNGTAQLHFWCGVYATGWVDLDLNGYPDKFGNTIDDIPQVKTRILLIKNIQIGNENMATPS